MCARRSPCPRLPLPWDTHGAKAVPTLFAWLVYAIVAPAGEKAKENWWPWTMYVLFAPMLATEVALCLLQVSPGPRGPCACPRVNTRCRRLPSPARRPSGGRFPTCILHLRPATPPTMYRLYGGTLVTSTWVASGALACWRRLAQPSFVACESSRVLQPVLGLGWFGEGRTERVNLRTSVPSGAVLYYLIP